MPAGRAVLPCLQVVACLLVWAATARAQDFPALHHVTGVGAGDVLNIRSDPTARAAIIGSFGPGRTGIEVIALSDNGRWARVNAGARPGWVARRYLARSLPGSWMDGTQPLTCRGHDPFWHLTAFLPGHQAEFVTADNGGVNLVTDAGALPRTRHPATLAIPFSGALQGMAVLRPGACDDGATGRAHGIAAQVYLRGQPEGLTGCCTLSD